MKEGLCVHWDCGKKKAEEPLLMGKGANLTGGKKRGKSRETEKENNRPSPEKFTLRRRSGRG